MPVIDASVLVSYLGGEELAEPAGDLIEAGQAELFAPHLIDAEVGHALRRLVTAGRLESEDAEESLSELAQLPLLRTPHTLLLGSAWGLRANVSFYDALYLALGQELELPVITTDARLVRAATKLPVEVLPLG